MSSNLDIISHYLNRSNAAPPPTPPANASASTPRSMQTAATEDYHYGHQSSSNPINSTMPHFMDMPPPVVDPNPGERLTITERRDRMLEALGNGDLKTLRVELDKLSWNEQLQVTREEFLDDRIGIGSVVKRIWQTEGVATDIRARAGRLYTRWQDGVFTSDATQRWTTGSSSRRHTQSERGDMGFIVGEVFVNRAALIASKMHPALQAGIQGRVSEGGAISILVSNSDYEDYDAGNELWYSGTRSSDGEMSKGTELLDKSYKERLAVRVLRTDKAPWRHRPAFGIRYDGLYIIDDKKRTREGGGNFKYHLTRLENQFPIQTTPHRDEARLLQFYANNGVMAK